MRIIRNGLIFSFLMLFAFFSFINIGLAGYTIVDEGNGNIGGNTGTGGGKDCYSASACWNPSVPTPLAGARVTLVDKNGKIVEGTHSVDIKKSSDNSVHTSGVKFEFMGTKAALITWGTGSNTTYDYKNGTNPYYISVPGEESPRTDYTLISIPVFFESSDPSKGIANGKDVNGRMTYGYFSDVYTNRKKVYPYKNDADPTDFLSLYLHFNGYLTDEDNVVDIDELQYTNSTKYYKLREYSLIFEPIFTTYSNSVGMAFYGTGKDFLKAMYRQTDTWEKRIQEGLGGWDQVKQFACALYTSHSTGITNLGTMNQDCYSMYSLGRNISGYNPVAFYKSGDEVYLDKYGFSMASSYLGEVIQPPSYPTFNFLEKKCNEGSKNDTTFSFSLASTRDYINSHMDFFDLEKNGTKIFDPGDQGISCVDSVEYDFHDLIYGVKDENGNETPGLYGEKEFNSIVPISIFPVKARVTRFCPSTTAMNSDIIKSDFTNVFSVHYLNSYINFKAPTVSCSSASSRHVVEYSCELVYEPASNTLTLKSGSYSAFKNGIEDGKGTITFTNKAYGRNNKLIEMFDNNGKSVWSGDEGSSVYYSLESSGDSLTCNFEYSVDGCGDECDPSLGDNNLKFRVISLDNPFPNRDGTSRLPGVNWLNKENYVYEYISNNRGVVYRTYNEWGRGASYSPEDMYNLVEPMYTVTLTPETMRKIRRYNGNYSYYSMYDVDYSESDAGANETVRQKDRIAYKLNCNSNNRECYSTFLRSGAFIPRSDLTGTCVIEDDLSLVRSQLNAADPVQSLSLVERYVGHRAENPDFYRAGADLNKNGRLDKWDVIVATYPERNTKYYTCADKTFLSGGPLEGDE